MADMCDRWMTDGVRDRLGAVDRSRIAALEDIDRLVRLAHIELAVVRRELTGLRWDEGDTRLAVTGRVALDALEPDRHPEIVTGAVTLVLRPRQASEGQDDVTVPVIRQGRRSPGCSTWACSPRGLGRPRGRRVRGVVRTARLGADRDGQIARPAPRMIGGVIALPYFTRPYGNLSVDIGGHVVTPSGVVRLARSRWAAGHRLVLDGEITMGAITPDARAVRRLVWRERSSGRERRVPVAARAGGVHGAAGVRAAGARHLGRLPGTGPRRAAGAVPDRGGGGAGRAAAHVVAGVVLRTVKPYATAGKGRLSVIVRTVTPKAFLRRFLP
nr:hypothetical protein GCM10020093_086620 [Planobispora longispora]